MCGGKTILQEIEVNASEPVFMLLKSPKISFILVYATVFSNVLQGIGSPGRSSTGPTPEWPIICPTWLRSIRLQDSLRSLPTPFKWRPWLPKAKVSFHHRPYRLVYLQVSVLMRAEKWHDNYRKWLDKKLAPFLPWHMICLLLPPKPSLNRAARSSHQLSHL